MPLLTLIEGSENYQKLFAKEKNIVPSLKYHWFKGPFFENSGPLKIGKNRGSTFSKRLKNVLEV